MASGRTDHGTRREHAVTVGVLGPIAVRRAATPVPVTGTMRRRLLAMLATSPGTAVRDDVLVDRLWHGAPPATATFSLRNRVRELRDLLGSDAITRSDGGYRLGDVALDVEQFTLLVSEAAQCASGGHRREALVRLDAALALVRGPLLDDVRDEAWAFAIVRSWEELVLAAEDRRFEMALRDGSDIDRIVPELWAATASHPEREARWCHLVGALSRCGRRTEAMRAAGEARRALAEFGMAPGPPLLEAERRVLATAPLELPALATPSRAARHAENLLALPTRTEAEDEALDEAITAVLRELLEAVEIEVACDVASRYLAGAGRTRDTTTSRHARVLAATALITGGDPARGKALLDAVLESHHDVDPALVADAVLAHGPIATGSPHGARIAEHAELLLGRIDPDDTSRRVQLACWAAHHHLDTGDRDHALALVDAVSAEASSSPVPQWRGLVLAVRCEAEWMASASPRRALVSLEELRRWSVLTGDAASRAAVAVFDVPAQWMTSTVVDVRTAIDRLEEESTRLPRPDLSWLPLAMRAAVALALRDHDDAEAAIARAEEMGRRLGVVTADPVASLQRAALLDQRGDLPAVRPLLEGVLARRPSPVAAALHGLACVRAGDRSGAAASAEVLMAHPRPLDVSGRLWPVVAAAGASLAAFLHHEALATALWPLLARWSGHGLSAHGLLYVGPADLVLAQLAEVVQPGTEARLREHAAAQERRRGCAGAR